MEVSGRCLETAAPGNDRHPFFDNGDGPCQPSSHSVKGFDAHGILGLSLPTYAEAVPIQTLPSWMAAHQRSLRPGAG